MTNEPLTAEQILANKRMAVEAMAHHNDVEAGRCPYSTVRTLEIVREYAEAYAAQEVAKATAGLQAHNSLLADALKTVIENCEHYLIGEASMGGAYVENNFTGVGHEALDATAETVKQWESRIEMRMAFKVGDKLAAQVVELETELEQLRKDKPIPHNGKLYWPDANGWYEMECCKKPTGRVLLSDGKHVGEGHWYSLGNSWAYDFLTFGVKPKQPIKWQPLPAGPVEGG